MKSKLKSVHYCMVLFVAVIFCSSAIGAEVQYAHGHSALEVFDGIGFKDTPIWVQAWIGLMISTFVVGFFFAWKHVLARWAVGGLILSLASGDVIFALLGLPFLGGSIAIMHIICWSPALVLLLIKRPFLNETEVTSFRIWSGLMTCVIIFSFIFDIKDAVIYIQHISNLS